MEQNNPQVRFQLPSYVKNTAAAFDGCTVTVEYDSNYGGTQTVEGVAEIQEGRWPSDFDHLVVDGRKVRSNGHVFSAEDDRHLGTVESITVEIDEQTAIDMATQSIEHDIDRGNDVTIIQTWDKSVMEQEGHIAGTGEIRLAHI